jgi:phosphoribosylaminoimidazole-succinocarboxamide synthase
MGILILDTKLEGSKYGMIADEIFTPDSSRFTTVKDFKQAINEERDPIFFDKEPVRIWGKTIKTPFNIIGINNLDPKNKEHVDFVHSLIVPAKIIEDTQSRYHWIFEALTGFTLASYQKKFMFI